MSVIHLVYLTDYDGSQIIGAYTTVEAAEAERQRRDDEMTRVLGKKLMFTFAVAEVSLDADPDESFSTVCI